jgi:hypothetical protein
VPVQQKQRLHQTLLVGRKARAELAPRTESKGAKILELIGRPKGATLAEIMKATNCPLRVLLSCQAVRVPRSPLSA